MVAKSFLSILIVFAASASHAVRLSQKDVAELVLKQGRATKEVTYTYEQKYSDYLRVLSSTDWSASLETGYTEDKLESLSRIGDYKLRRYVTTANLSKNLVTGTAFSASIGRTAQRTDLSPVTTAAPQMHEDVFSLRLEQDLWGNFFGRGTRATINASEYSYQAQSGLRAEDLENVVLDSIRLFWNTYVAQETFRQALGSRERYEKLVAAVRRKNSLGYANPGELSQVSAEFESRSQTVKNASVAYLRNLDILLTSLSLPAGTEVDFVIPKEIPPVPKLVEKPLEDLRIVKTNELLLKAAKENAAYYQTTTQPKLKLIGQVNSSGVEETAEASYSELTAGTHPSYYVGVRLSHTFGSGYNSESVRAARANEALQEARLSRLKAEQQDRFSGIERSVGATYAIAVSKQTELNLREKAVQELTRTYNQGRTNINALIEEMNKLFETQVQSIIALGNYNIALNEWAAARDELIPDQKQESP